MHWGTVIKRKVKDASEHLAGRPVGLVLLGLFLPPAFAMSGDHPLWIVSWDRRLKEKKNIQCSGEEENYEEDGVTIYLVNFLNPIEARSYFKSQYSLCFLTYLSLK